MKILLFSFFLVPFLVHAGEPLRWYEIEAENTPAPFVFGNGTWLGLLNGRHTSVDGLNWFKRSNNHSNLKPHFLRGEFYYWDTTIWASSNGWSDLRAVGTTPFGSGVTDRMIFGNNQFYAVSLNQMASSVDGTLWTRSTLPELQGTLKLMAAGSGAVVIVTTAGIVYSSQDGHTWVSVELGFSLADLQATANGFLAVQYFYQPGSGTFASRLHHSSNGEEWHVVQEKPGLADRICVGPQRVAIWGQDILGLVAQDGRDWTDVVRPSRNIISDLTYGDGRFLGVMWPSGMVSSSPFAPPRIETIARDGRMVFLEANPAEGYVVERTEELGTAWTQVANTTLTERGFQFDEPASSNVFYRLSWREP